MKKYEEEMRNVLYALNESNVLKDVIISGSWAMYFYTYIFTNFVPRAETTDLDLYLPSPKHIASDNLAAQLMKYSYRQHNDYITGKTTFLSPDGFALEFLTIPDRNMENTIKIKGLNIVAEALPKMAPAGWNYIQVKYDNLDVNVVSPVSFVLQKLLINKERQPEYKREKDLDAIKYVLEYIKASSKYFDELKNSLDSYPRKWKKAIIETADANNINLLN